MFGDFLALALRSDPEPRGEVSRHVQRPRGESARRPHSDGRRARLWPDPQPEPREAFRRAFRGCGTRPAWTHAHREIYQALAGFETPTLVIENKLLYRERCDAPLPPGYRCSSRAATFPTTILRPATSAGPHGRCFRRMSLFAERVAAGSPKRTKYPRELLFPLAVSPFDVHRSPVYRADRQITRRRGRHQGFDLASEVMPPPHRPIAEAIACTCAASPHEQCRFRARSLSSSACCRMLRCSTPRAWSCSMSEPFAVLVPQMNPNDEHRRPRPLARPVRRRVRAGQPLVTLETTKATFDVDAPRKVPAFYVHGRRRSSPWARRSLGSAKGCPPPVLAAPRVAC